MTILVTGATGDLGGYALRYLKELDSTADILALARNEEKAQTLKDEGFEVRLGDYSDLDSLNKAFEGVDRLLFVSAGMENRAELQANVVAAAKEQGVSYIAYTSLTNAQESTSPLAADHKTTEALIKDSGIAYTFLRNNWYLENELPLIDVAFKTGRLVYTTGNAKAAWALKREYAKVAAKAVLAGDFPEVLELSGKNYTYEELGEAINTVSDTKIEVVSGDGQAFKENLIASGFPEHVADIFLSFQDVITGHALEFDSNDFERYLGEPLVSLEDGLKELLM